MVSAHKLYELWTMPLRVGAALILCAVSAYGQYLHSYISSWLHNFLAARLTVTWNGNTVDAPMLLYHDEIYVSTNGTAPFSSEGILVCSNQSGSVWWHYPDLTIVPPSTVPTFYQIKASESVSTLLRGIDISENATWFNGLWSCQLSSFEVSTVGLYERGMGE